MAPQPPADRASRRAPPTLDGLWRASELGRRARAAVWPTGHGALDAVLPGGGWPVGAVTELLVPSASRHEWDLLAPALARLPAGQVVVLVGAPQAGCTPFGPALAGRGVAPERLLWVQAESAPGLLWATGQTLRCREVGAVLTWLPRVRSAALRSLQVLAQSHGKLLFVVREPVQAGQASPAPLRLGLQAEPCHAVTGTVASSPMLSVQVVKRQGPPLDRPVRLAAGPSRLHAQLQASGSERLRRRGAGLPPVPQPGGGVAPPWGTPRPGVRDALDRTAAVG